MILDHKKNASGSLAVENSASYGWDAGLLFLQAKRLFKDRQLAFKSCQLSICNGTYFTYSTYSFQMKRKKLEKPLERCGFIEKVVLMDGSRFR